MLRTRLARSRPQLGRARYRTHPREAGPGPAAPGSTRGARNCPSDAYLLHRGAGNACVVVDAWVSPPRLLLGVRKRALCPVVDEALGAGQHLHTNDEFGRKERAEGGGAGATQSRRSPKQKLVALLPSSRRTAIPLRILRARERHPSERRGSGGAGREGTRLRVSLGSRCAPLPSCVACGKSRS